MILDNHKTKAFFGEEFAQYLHTFFKLSPTAVVRLLSHPNDSYSVEVVAPNPISTELEQTIQKLLTSAVLHEYIQERLSVDDVLTVWQTGDSPPTVMLT